MTDPRRAPTGTTTSPNPLRPSGRMSPGGINERFNGPPVGSWEYRMNRPKAEVPAPPDERHLATILDKTIPIAFGARRVSGLIGAYSFNESTFVATLGVVFAYGEQDSIATTTTYINGEALTAISAVTSPTVHVGDGSTALSALLTGMTGWTAADTTLWKKYAHAVFRIDCKLMRVPADGQITSDLGGMLVDASWRSGGSASVATTNPVEVAYELTTSADYRGVASTQIDTDSWEAVADWCDDVMSDASARYEYNGIVTNRNTAAGVGEVLGLPLAYEYIGDDGKLHLWCEMSPPAITGEWSATASATITEDSTAGEATTELTVGDYVYVGTDLRTVSEITDDDTVVLDSAVTVSGVSVRPLSQVYIHKYDWAQPLAAHEASKLSTPDKYRVRFADGENLGSHEVLSTYGAGTDKIVEGYLDGCISATVATRHSETTLKVEWLQPWYWQGIVWQDIGAQLEIGDVVLFDDDVLTQQAARVIPPIVARPDGTYLINLREYDPSSYSDSTDTTDTPPSLGSGWSAGGVPVVSTLYSLYSGTLYDAISYDGSGRQVYGDTAAATTVTGTQIRLPNNIPLYGLKTGGSTVGLIKVNTSDMIEIGDGGEALYINAGTSTYGVVIPADVPLAANPASTYQIAKYDSSNTRMELGDASIDTRVLGVPATVQGITNYAGAPTAAQMSAGYWGIVRDTSGGHTYLVYNRGGTIEKVELT